MSTIRVYDPTAVSVSREARLARRPESLRGLTVGILDNEKPNAGVLMRELAAALAERHGTAGVVVRTKPVAGPASPETVKVLTEQAGLVLVGSAD